MALLEEQFTEKLETGAPDITYEGSEGKEQQIAQALWDKLPPQLRMQFGSFNQFFSSGAWKQVLAVLQQQMQGGQEEIQETTEVMQPAAQQGLGSMMQGPRPMAQGGIAGLDGRRAFGFGSFVGDIFGGAGDLVGDVLGKVKDFAKTPVGKAALMYALTAGVGHGMQPGAQKWANLDWLKPSAVKGAWLGSGSTEGILPALNLTKGAGSYMPTWLGAGAAAAASPLIMGLGKDKPPEDFPLKGGKFNINYDEMRQDIAEAVSAGDYEEFKAVLAEYDLTEGVQVPYWDTLRTGSAEGGRIGYGLGRLVGLGSVSGVATPNSNQGSSRIGNSFMGSLIPRAVDAGILSAPQRSQGSNDSLQNAYALYVSNGGELSFSEWVSQQNAAQGGRIGAQEGGLMDLGGMEKDYRQEGGFVPIGGKEKADDVPARLSRNEFVFTADAVRNAGGGDIDQGAEIMENVMKNLERGGEISQESQGLEGARDMFQVSERLSEVV